MAVVVFAACGRGPGTLQGLVDRKPFDLRQARLTIPRGEARFVIEAQDQETTCGQKVKLGSIVTLALEVPANQPLPQGVKYPLSEGPGLRVPGVVVQRVATDTLCNITRTVAADAADVELVEVRTDDAARAVEADLRVTLTFGDEVLTGSVHATTDTCTASAPFFCDAN